MKKITLQLLLIGISSHLGGQSYPLRDRLDLIFANIDKSQVPTGFLAEFGAPLVPLDVFNGVLSDSNKVNISVWRQVYATLQTSRIYGLNPLPYLSAVNTSLENVEAANPGVLPVPLLYADYAYLRPDAITLNLLSVQNNQLYDVLGRTLSPYFSRSIFAGAASVGYADNGTPSLLFKQELFFKQSSKALSFIQVDFNDGRGFLTAAWDIPISAQYTTKGSKQIKIKLTFTDATTVQCYSFIEITDIPSTQARFASPFDHKETFPVTPGHSGGKVYVKYSVTNTTSPKRIKKPLIVVEGYDVSLIAPKLQGKNYSFQDFLNGLNAIIGYDLNYKLDDLAGYDLVFLDYNNGTDDIRRNAYLLEAVITWVNIQKIGVPGNHPNVVLGISMGGLVARYALAEMTKLYLNPQTRLLITHDSPHRGANTPLGFQALTRAMDEADILPWLSVSDLVPEVQQSVNVLNAPAT